MRGTIIHRRRCSRKLLFYDLEVALSAKPGGGAGGASQASGPPQVVELMLKIESGGQTVESIEALRHALHLGDLVVATGQAESVRSGSAALACSHISVVLAWRTAQPLAQWRPRAPAALPLERRVRACALRVRPGLSAGLEALSA